MTDPMIEAFKIETEFQTELRDRITDYLTRLDGKHYPNDLPHASTREALVFNLGPRGRYWKSRAPTAAEVDIVTAAMLEDGTLVPYEFTNGMPALRLVIEGEGS